MPDVMQITIHRTPTRTTLVGLMIFSLTSILQAQSPDGIPVHTDIMTGPMGRAFSKGSCWLLGHRPMDGERLRSVA